MIRDRDDERQSEESSADSYLQMILEGLAHPFESDAEYATLYGVRQVQDSVTEGVDLVDRDGLENLLMKACMVGDTEDEHVDYAEQMLNYAFESPNYYQRLNELYANKPKARGPCRKVIEGPTGYSYRCLDCQRNASSVVCQDCFDNSRHEGHR